MEMRNPWGVLYKNRLFDYNFTVPFQIGQPLYCKIKITGARGLPANIDKVRSCYVLR